MRWEALFADLSGQFEAEEAAAAAAEVADRSRRELSRLALADRLRGATGQSIDLRLVGGVMIVGRLAALGSDWLLLAEPTGRETLVPLAAVRTVRGGGRQATEPAGPVDRRLGLGVLLRGLARDRAPVRVLLRDGGALTGTVERVGADFFELAEHPMEEPPRPDPVAGGTLLPFGAIAAVRSG